MELVSSSGWNQYGEDFVQPQGKGCIQLSPALTIPQPDLSAFTKKGKVEPVLPDSKWARKEDGSDNEDKTQDMGLSYSSSGSENAADGPSKVNDVEVSTDLSTLSHLDSGISEEQRQKLRRLEVAVMEYRESIEEQGVRSPGEIEKKVASHRRRLISDFGLLGSDADVPGNTRRPSQSSLERKDRRGDLREPSWKRHRSQSPSRSPQRKSLSTRDRDGETDLDRDLDRQRVRERGHELEIERVREHEKSGSRERDDPDKDKGRERHGQKDFPSW